MGINLKKDFTITTITIISLILILIFMRNTSAAVDTPYSYNKEEKITTWFFPIDQARWDGYRVISNEWKELDEDQKRKFIIEGMREFERLEKIKIGCFDEQDIMDIKGTLNSISRLVELTDGTKEMFWLLHNLVELKGCFNGTAKHDLEAANKILNETADSILTSDIEFSKEYIGYVICGEVNGQWLKGYEPPLLNQEKNYTIYVKYRKGPGNVGMLVNNYPENYKYKIKAMREVDSFVDKWGVTAHFFEVTFERVK